VLVAAHISNNEALGYIVGWLIAGELQVIARKQRSTSTTLHVAVTSRLIVHACRLKIAL
jgi:hypothetical protein